MDLSQSRCFYHNDRVAVDKCEKCHKMICLQDKMTYRVSNIEYGDDIYTYCPICYNEVQQASKKASKFILVIFIVFIIIAFGSILLFAYFVMDMFNNLPFQDQSIFKNLVFSLKKLN